MATGSPPFGSFGKTRKIKILDLRAGMMLLDNIYGYKGRILVAEGEVLSQKHIDQLKTWCERPGIGCLLLYTREVNARACLRSAELRPRCDSDPYAAHSIQKWYKKGDKISFPQISKESAAKTRYKVINGKVVEV
jgi:hypothetical protein